MHRHRWLTVAAVVLAVALGLAIAGVPSRSTDPALPVSVGADDVQFSGDDTGTVPTASTVDSVPARPAATPTAGGTPTTLAAPPYPGDPLVIGDSGPAVVTWQERMRARGWDITTDGRYGVGAARVARAFQRQKGLRVTGEVDEATWRAAWQAPLPDDTTIPADD